MARVTCPKPRRAKFRQLRTFDSHASGTFGYVLNWRSARRRIERRTNRSEKRGWRGAPTGLALTVLLTACSATDSPTQAEPAPGSTSTEPETESTTSQTDGEAPRTTSAPTSTQPPPTTTPTTTSVDPFSRSPFEDLLSRAQPLDQGKGITISDSGFVATGSVPGGYGIGRSTDGETWTFEEISGLPESTRSVVDVVETSTGFVALIETEFQRAALLTSSDLVAWRREAIPDVLGRPEAFAISRDQVAIVLQHDPGLRPRDVTIIAGPIGGPYTAAPAPFNSWEFEDTFIGSPGGFLAASNEVVISDDERRFSRSGPISVLWSADGVSWQSISPIEELPATSVSAAMHGDGIVLAVNRAGTTSVWISNDMGASWSESEIQVGAALVTARAGEAGYAVQTLDEASHQDFELWFSPDGDVWTLADTWEMRDRPTEPGFFAAGLRSLAGVGEDFVSIRVDVFGYTTFDSDLGTGSFYGSFLERLDIG